MSLGLQEFVACHRRKNRPARLESEVVSRKARQPPPTNPFSAANLVDSESGVHGSLRIGLFRQISSWQEYTSCSARATGRV